MTLNRDLANGGPAPVLLVDIDGVISIYGWDRGARPPGAFASVDGIVHYLAEGMAQRLARLGDAFELVWCSGWEEKANEHLPHLLGLPGPLPYLRFDERPRSGGAHWKLGTIAAHAGDRRPLAWVDDSFDDGCLHWAKQRSGPTLLVTTAPAVGLTDADVERLLDWAADL
jgi:hypothetical protein